MKKHNPFTYFCFRTTVQFVQILLVYTLKSFIVISKMILDKKQSASEIQYLFS